MEDCVFGHDANLYSFFINVKNCLTVAEVDERKTVGEKLISDIRDMMITSSNHFIQEISDPFVRGYAISYTNHHLHQIIQYIDDKVNYRDLERQQIKHRNYKRLYFKLRRRYVESSMGKACDDYLSMMRLKFSYSLSEEKSPFNDVQEKILSMRKEISDLSP